MVRVDFTQVDDADNYVSVPNGTYLCRIGEVRARIGDDGAERWGVRWIVADGPYAGRTAAWDALTFSAKGLRRAKIILQRLAVPVDGPQELRPADIEGRVARVTVYARERLDPITQRRVISNRVPFAGVETATEEERQLAQLGRGSEPAMGELPADAFSEEGLED
ncbi:MAG: hypothetical protein JNJ88_00510 [Planctomycetes bacterium]|nr:hypothetical protein [Planctomycetota bacterium]